MLQFTDENILWLSLLVENALKKTNDQQKSSKLLILLDKIKALNQHDLTINITEQQIKDTDKVISDLEEITSYYTSITDIGALEDYDRIKKEMAGLLQYLSSYKDLFLNEKDYLENKLKKEKRIEIAMLIKDEDKVSLTQAMNLVEKDQRYIILRDQYYYIDRIANRVKTKYQFYLQLWQNVFQSVSTASKEKFTTKYNND